ncbi:MAG: hypothetical protein ABJC19_03800 [Gemmatimonadota bacterium]
MSDHAVTVSLESSGGSVTTASGTLQRFSPPQRALRAGVFLLLGLGGAAMLIPVPIIHLVGIPLMLVVGIVAAMKQLRASARLKPMRLACPACEAKNRIGGGFGYHTADAPMDLSCDSCRRGLTLRIAEQ